VAGAQFWSTQERRVRAYQLRGGRAVHVGPEGTAGEAPQAVDLQGEAHQPPVGGHANRTRAHVIIYSPPPHTPYNPFTEFLKTTFLFQPVKSISILSPTLFFTVNNILKIEGLTPGRFSSNQNTYESYPFKLIITVLSLFDGRSWFEKNEDFLFGSIRGKANFKL
jgi:hypothetical protein